MTTLIRSAVVGGVTLALALAPSDTSAQESSRSLIGDLPVADQMQIRDEARARDHQANELLRRAREAWKSAKWNEAAKRFEESAQHRTNSHRLGIESLERAGKAYYLAGDVEKASEMLEEAANRSLLVGDVLEAAGNYVAAAMAARDAGDDTRAVEIGWKAYHLSGSDHLTDEQRNLILRQLYVESGRTG